MENNHKLALYVCYYLARFNKSAYKRLKFGNQTETHNRIATILSVKANSVQNWRDEFDPLFGHRAGWHQRPLSPSRVQVVSALSDLNEDEIYIIVRKILNLTQDNITNIEPLFNIINPREQDTNDRFIARMHTGKDAEEFFIKYHHNYKLPIDGVLKDTRDYGCGYDFEIHTSDQKYFIEVKGISDQTGGILFTNKEWQVAKNTGDKYFIVLVSNLNDKPHLDFIQNPFSVLTPKENIVTTIQVNWSVTSKELKSIL